MSTRFAVAVHILTVLAFHKGEPVPSALIAKSVNTSPAVVRQILMRLRKAGLVDARLGKGGGSFLARPADTIDLLEVYQATEEEDRLFCTHRSGPSEGCTIGRHILPALSTITQRAEQALFAELKRATIGAMVEEIQSRAATT